MLFEISMPYHLNQLTLINLSPFLRAGNYFPYRLFGKQIVQWLFGSFLQQKGGKGIRKIAIHMTSRSLSCNNVDKVCDPA